MEKKRINILKRILNMLVLMSEVMNMARAQQEKQEEPKPTEPEQISTSVQVVEPKSINDLFKRSVNGNQPAVSLTLKRVLTRPLVSMGKTKQLAIECQSEMYTIDLPLKGRAGGMSPCRVIDVKDKVTGEEEILIIHEMMASSLERAAFRVLKTGKNEDGDTTYTEKPGTPLNGKSFAFVSGDMVADKNYRVVSVAELNT